MKGSKSSIAPAKATMAKMVSIPLSISA